jgi:hypothetical protein
MVKWYGCAEIRNLSNKEAKSISNLRPKNIIFKEYYWYCIRFYIARSFSPLIAFITPIM